MKKQVIKLMHQGTLLTTTDSLHSLDLPTLYHHHDDLSQLDAHFSTAEVQNAVQQLALNKASGLDGLPNEFIKQNWQTLQPYIMTVFHQLYSGQADLSSINEARIVLIPKTDAPLTVSDFRPISVLKVIPKLISKVLANRIKQFMPSLISQHQTAFVQGRFIVENFLATREALHHVHRSRSPACLLKLDFAKAFDSLDWNFLQRVMLFRGFPLRFMNWIEHILSTSASRIQINGHLSPPFTHKRGLRQGDPIFPTSTSLPPTFSNK